MTDLKSTSDSLARVFPARELKRRATEAVNERLRPVRVRRSELIGDRGYLRTAQRSEAARSIAQTSLTQVATAMHTDYAAK